ncbi:2-dehydro-3-deoxygalactonokinase [Dorea sp. D27]|uniref:2-dehydro-3-deoxygalactonokinase n=1 Tax=Dorea sp. D27 TaxID=658665 RepID=UPI0006739988|nr:2-dehydro-3-deoxygalactonokinase [Dorea sp. D27]KMZ52983.1 2-dehydro-3-deoxygalactonokinase [Dorea sp. D27]
MYYIIIDCGTTNARAYVVGEDGSIAGRASKKVGVRDTSITGSKVVLTEGLKDTVAKAVQVAGLEDKDIRAVFSSGMITSEIGLCELPHLTAPCGAEDLAAHMELVEGLDLYAGKPVYFVRGIKNKMAEDIENPFAAAGCLDFMRGEETQTMGILQDKGIVLPATVVVLSSHTKFISVDSSGKILGSLTTMSGQTFEAVKNNTFLTKSLEDDGSGAPEGYFDEAVVEHAASWIRTAGLVRSFMFPRFLDVLLDTKWYERRLFFEALIAADDMLSLGQMDMFGLGRPHRFVLVGLKERCRLYEYILRKEYGEIEVSAISDKEQVDRLSIEGMLAIAKKAGIIR